MNSITDVYGNTITVAARDMLGNPTQVTEGNDTFTYSYGTTGNNQERLTSVSLARKLGASSHVIAEAQYTYYADNSANAKGEGGDLQQVRVSESASADPTSSSYALQEVGGSYYRYVSSEAGASAPDLLANAVTGDAYARLVGSVLAANHLTAPPANGFAGLLDNANVSDYADHFDYDTHARAILQALVGMGASSMPDQNASPAAAAEALSAIGTLRYGYTAGPGVGINSWNQETTISLPSGATQAVYTNYGGEPMLSALTDNSDTVNSALSGLTWNTYFDYDPLGRLLLTAQPSAGVQPNSSQSDLGGAAALLSGSTGLVEGTDYYADDDVPNTPVGFVKDTYDVQGQGAMSAMQGEAPSSEALQDYYQYVQLSGGGVSIYAVSDDTEFSNATANVGDSSGRDTSFQYLNNSLPVMQMTETPPSISSQNGIVGTGNIVTSYNSDGTLHSVTDADGYTTSYGYDATNGTDEVTSTTVGLTTATGGPTITTSSVPDLLGRPVQSTDGNGNMTKIAYSDGLLVSTVTTTPPLVSPTAAPTTSVVTNLGNGTITTFSTVPSGATAKVSEVWQDLADRTVQTQQYDGWSNAPTDVYTTLDKYDASGNLYWAQDAVGTITKTDFDELGRPTNVWVSAIDSDGTILPFMQTESEEYDNNSVGDGNLTETTQETQDSAAPNQIASSYYDWQDSLVAQNNGVQIVYDTLDNLGEVTQSGIYDATQTSVSSSAGEVSQPDASALRAQTSTVYDNQGDAYQTLVYSVNPADGTLNGSLVTNIYHDGRGDVVETVSPNGLATVTQYDGAGRVTLQQSGSAGTPDNLGTIVQSVATQYDADSNPIFLITSQLNTDTSQTSPDQTLTRTTYVGNWYDAAGRLTDSVNYGTNDNTAMTSRPTDPPLPSIRGQVPPTVLFTHYDYDAGGFLRMTTDPTGTATSYSNDYLGRVSALDPARWTVFGLS